MGREIGKNVSKISVHRAGLVVTKANDPPALKHLSRRQNQNEILTQGKDMLGLVLLLCSRCFAWVLLILLIDELFLGSGSALHEHALVSSDRLTALCLYDAVLVGVLKKRRDAIIAGQSRTFKYSSLASCHSLVIVFGRWGFANMRVIEKTTQAAAMMAVESKKTLRPSSGGGGRRGPWGPNAI
jgi:hypothetical protein